MEVHLLVPCLANSLHHHLSILLSGYYMKVAHAAQICRLWNQIIPRNLISLLTQRAKRPEVDMKPQKRLFFKIFRS